MDDYLKKSQIESMNEVQTIKAHMIKFKQNFEEQLKLKEKVQGQCLVQEQQIENQKLEIKKLSEKVSQSKFNYFVQNQKDQETIQQLRIRIMKEVNSANEANMKYEDVQKQNQELEDRIREDESQHNSRKEEVKYIQSVCEQLKEELQTTKKQLKIKENQVDEIRIKHEQTQEVNSEQKCRLTKIELNLKQCNQENNQLRQEIRILIDQKNEALSQGSKERMMKEQELNNKNELIYQLKEQLANLNKEVNIQKIKNYQNENQENITNNELNINNQFNRYDQVRQEDYKFTQQPLKQNMNMINFNQDFNKNLKLSQIQQQEQALVQLQMKKDQLEAELRKLDGQRARSQNQIMYKNQVENDYQGVQKQITQVKTALRSQNAF